MNVFISPLHPAVNQEYVVDIFRATVINGNDALLKCDIPSFVADFVQVSGWIDSEGSTILPGANANSTSGKGSVSYLVLSLLDLRT